MSEDLQLLRKVFHLHKALVDGLKMLSQLEGRPEAEIVRSYLYPAVQAKIKEHSLIQLAIGQASQREGKLKQSDQTT